MCARTLVPFVIRRVVHKNFSLVQSHPRFSFLKLNFTLSVMSLQNDLANGYGLSRIIFVHSMSKLINQRNHILKPLLKMYINIYAYISTLTVRCKHSFLISIRPKNLFKIFCLSHKNHKMNAKNCIFPIKSGL